METTPTHTKSWLVCFCLILANSCSSEDEVEHDDVSVDASDIAVDGAVPTIQYEPHTVLDIPTNGGLADPHVIKVGEIWYLYATGSTVDLEVWYSEDLVTWHHGGIVWTPPAGSFGEAGDVWAPHVEVTQEGYYLYYTASFQIGLAFAESPLGPFEDLLEHPFVGGGFGGIGDGGFMGSWAGDYDEYAIDAFVLQAEDGSLTLYFTAYDPLASIRAIEMVDYETLAETEPVIVHSPDLSSWEGVVNEGAWVIERNSVIYLMYSGNLANTIDYAVGVARASSPLGPFEREHDNPLIHTNAEVGFYGPGHHSVVAGAFDDLLMFYHTKISPEQGWERAIRYAPISFDDNDQIQLDTAQP